MKYIGLYLLVVNVLAFALYGMDKRRARKGAWRIPESRLLGISALGGSPGAIAGMLFFRHKTRHWKFVLGVPAILLLQLGFAYYLFRFSV